MEQGLQHIPERAQDLCQSDREDLRPRAIGKHARRTDDGYHVEADLPDKLPVFSEEIAILRAFLSDEIQAIIDGEDTDR